jgi:hypothetical protein
MPLKSVLRSHRGAVVVSMLLTWMLSAGIVVVILMTPALLQKIHHIARAPRWWPIPWRPCAWPSAASSPACWPTALGGKRVMFVGSVLLADHLRLLHHHRQPPRLLLPL